MSAEWVTAWATVVAAGGTVGALFVGAVTLRRQEENSRRSQAAGVSVRRRRFVNRNIGGEPQPDANEPPGLYVRNDGQHPAYDLNVLWAPKKGIRRSLFSVTVLLGESNEYVGLGLGPEGWVWVEFADPTGRYWRRWEDGTLDPLGGLACGTRMRLRRRAGKSDDE